MMSFLDLVIFAAIAIPASCLVYAAAAAIEAWIWKNHISDYRPEVSGNPLRKQSTPLEHRIRERKTSLSTLPVREV